MQNFKDFEPKRDYLKPLFSLYPFILEAWDRQDYSMALAYLRIFSQVRHPFFRAYDRLGQKENCADRYTEEDYTDWYIKKEALFDPYGPGPEDEWYLTLNLVEGVVSNLEGRHHEAMKALRDAISCSSTLSLEGYFLPVYAELAWAYLQGHLKYGSPELLYRAKETYEIILDFAPFESTIRRGHLHVLMRLSDYQGMQHALMDYLRWVSDPQKLRFRVLHECMLVWNDACVRADQIDPVLLSHIAHPQIRALYRLQDEWVPLPKPKPSQTQAHDYRKAYTGFEIRERFKEDYKEFSVSYADVNREAIARVVVLPAHQPVSLHEGCASLRAASDRKMPKLFELEAFSHQPEAMEDYLRELASYAPKAPEADAWMRQWLSMDFMATSKMLDLSGPWQDLIVRPLRMLHELLNFAFAKPESLESFESEDPLVHCMLEIAASANHKLWTSEARDVLDEKHWPVLLRFQRQGYVLNAIFEHRLLELVQFRIAAFCLVQEGSDQAVTRFEKQLWLLKSSADRSYRTHLQTFSSVYVLARILVLELFTINISIEAQVRALAMLLHHAMPQAPRAGTWLLWLLNPNLEKYYERVVNRTSSQLWDTVINALLEFKHFDCIQELYYPDCKNPEDYVVPRNEAMLKMVVNALEEGAKGDRVQRLWQSRQHEFSGILYVSRLQSLARLSRGEGFADFMAYMQNIQDFFPAESGLVTPHEKAHPLYYGVLDEKTASRGIKPLPNRGLQLFHRAMDVLKKDVFVLLSNFLIPVTDFLTPISYVFYKKYFEFFNQCARSDLPKLKHAVSAHALRSWRDVCAVLWSAPKVKPELANLENFCKNKRWKEAEGCLWELLRQVVHPDLIYLLICMIRQNAGFYLVKNPRRREIRALYLFLKKQFPTSSAAQVLKNSPELQKLEGATEKILEGKSVGDMAMPMSMPMALLQR